MIWLKLVAGIVATIALIAGGFAWKRDIEENATLRRDRQTLEATLRQERQLRAAADQAVKEYRDEKAQLEALRRRADAGARPVRVCRESAPAAAAVPGARDPARAQGSAREPAAAGVLQDGGREGVTAGPDIGPGLRALWDRADDVSAACRALFDLADAPERLSSDEVP